MKLIGLGLYLSVNSHSLENEESLKLIQQVPIDRILVETNSPHCEITSKHYAYQYMMTRFKYKTANEKKTGRNSLVLKKGRNEPCTLGQLCEIIACIKRTLIEEVVDITYRNAVKVFGLIRSNSKLFRVSGRHEVDNWGQMVPLYKALEDVSLLL